MSQNISISLDFSHKAQSVTCSQAASVLIHLRFVVPHFVASYGWNHRASPLYCKAFSFHILFGDSSVLLHAPALCSFCWAVFLVRHGLLIHPLVGGHLGYFSFWWWWIKLPWAFLHQTFCGYTFSFIFSKHLRVEMQGMSGFISKRHTILHSHQWCRRISVALHPHQYSVLYFHSPTHPKFYWYITDI